MIFAKIAHKVANIPFIKKFLTENRLMVRLYFNWRYRSEDPYHVQTSGYEKEKYRRTAAALDFKDRFESILEVGCGEGLLTEMIAPKSDRVLAVDISDLAIKRAQQRLAGLSNVEARRADILNDDPDEAFELVLLSEVLFYFEPQQLKGVVDRITRLIKPGGYALLAHARAVADDDSGVELKKFGAKTIHGMFMNDPRYEVIHDEKEPMYQITVVRKAE